MSDNDIAEIDIIGQVAVVAFLATSISDAKGISAATERINKLIETSSPKAMIIDFQKVKFFSSQVLGTLLIIKNKMETKGGKIVIAGIDPNLHRIFKITNLDKIFEFYPNKETALKALS